jgi:hypothetical protein
MRSWDPESAFACCSGTNHPRCLWYLGARSFTVRTPSGCEHSWWRVMGPSGTSTQTYRPVRELASAQATRWVALGSVARHRHVAEALGSNRPAARDSRAAPPIRTGAIPVLDAFLDHNGSLLPTLAASSPGSGASDTRKTYALISRGSKGHFGGVCSPDP